MSRFIDDSPEFLYVPSGEVMRIAAESGAIPYDMPNVELGHHGTRCSFDALYAWCSNTPLKQVGRFLGLK